MSSIELSQYWISNFDIDIEKNIDIQYDFRYHMGDNIKLPNDDSQAF